MTDLYSRLYRYRERARRSPLENYLTEALSDFLNRCPGEVKIRFVADLLMPERGKVAWEQSREEFNTLSSRTQVSIRVADKLGLPDMVIESDGRTLLVVENKVGHGVGKYHDEQVGPVGQRLLGRARGPSDGQSLSKTRPDEESADRNFVYSEVETKDQLELYGQWLSNQLKGTPWKGCLTLLTHYTVSPTDFLNLEEARYGSTFRHVATWGSVYRWLVSSCGVRPNIDQTNFPAWKTLGRELAIFLREKGMSGEEMTSLDFAACQVYLSSHARFINTFRRVYAKVRTLADTMKTKGGVNDKQVEHNSQGKLVWQWIWLNAEYAPPYSKWFIAWGIRYVDGSENWIDANPALPLVDHAFVVLGSDNMRIPLARLTDQERPLGWSLSGNERDGMELVIGRTLADLYLQADQFADRFGTWVEERILELKPVLLKLRSFAQVADSSLEANSKKEGGQITKVQDMPK